MKRLVALCFLLFLFVSIAVSNSPAALSPQEIVDKMVAVYANCNSYTDEGQVSTLFIQKLGNRTMILPFTTAFVRPSEFRYEFKDRRGENEWNNYIISMKGDDVKTFWSIRPDRPSAPNLETAIGAATGVSGGSANTVPRLLMPDRFGYNRFKMLSQLQIISEEQVNGADAYKIEGTDSRGNKISFWVDKEKLLLLKIYEARKINDFETETTTTYKPSMNITVTEEKLEFKPANAK
jgi:outer membrane lipoprotein-sorting protein